VRFGLLALIIAGALAQAQTDIQELPNLGQQITPLAPQGSQFQPMNPDLPGNPAWLAGQAVTTVVSPDHKTLLVLTSGYNRIFYTDGPNAGKMNLPDSTEYVFIYDISAPSPVKKQVLKIPNTYNGIVFDPSGTAFYVAGGVDDKIHIVTLSTTGTWEEQAGTPPLVLGNGMGLGLAVQPNSEPLPINIRVYVRPCAAGVAISADGNTLVVANYYNDSITVFKGGLGNWSPGTELDLRHGKSDA